MKQDPPENINKKSQLISGIGASSWFYISLSEEKYKIERYSEEGELECSRIFQVNDKSFDIEKPYQFTYLSHCKQCTIIQNKIKFIFISEKN